MTSTSSPGYYYKQLLREMPAEVVLEMLEPDLRQLILANNIPPTSYGDIVARLVDIRSIVKNAELRQSLLDFLPIEKHFELAQRMGITNKPEDSKLDTGFFEDSNRRKILLEFLGVEPTADIEKAMPIVRQISPEYPFYDYQLQVAHQTYQYLSEWPHTAMVHMPTGSGKTRTAMHIVTRYLRERGPTSVLWLVSSVELIEQAAETFENAWKKLGDTDCIVVRWHGSTDINPHEFQNGNAFIVAGLQKLSMAENKDSSFAPALGQRVSLIVFDEAHQAIAPSYRGLVDSLRLAGQQNMALLGLSATPGRSFYDKSEELSEFFHKTKTTIATEKQDPIEYLIQEKYIARPHFKQIKYPDGTVRENRKAPEYSEKELNTLALDQARNQVIHEKIKELLNRHQKVIVFSPSVNHALVTAAFLGTEGYEIYAVTAQTPAGERRDILNRFSRLDGTPKALCNYGVFTTGFDVPTISAALVARPTKSLVLYSQMVGRAIRGVKSGGNEEAEIVTVVDTTLPGFRSVTEAFNNWEDMYRD